MAFEGIGRGFSISEAYGSSLRKFQKAFNLVSGMFERVQSVSRRFRKLGGFQCSFGRSSMSSKAFQVVSGGLKRFRNVPKIL